MKAVAYFRVSTAAQGRSGLGLEAQRQAVTSLARQRDLIVVEEFVEVESGKQNARQQLRLALHHAKMIGAVLVIAKLDRLSRNASFLLALRDSGVRFLAADVPDANDLTIGILAVIAQAEREAISNRTKEALSAAKARIACHGSYVSKRSGRSVHRLGNPNGASALRSGVGNSRAVRGAIQTADTRCEALRPLIEQLVAEGVRTTTGLAKALNDRGVITPRSALWHASTVAALVRRLSTLKS